MKQILTLAFLTATLAGCTTATTPGPNRAASAPTDVDRPVPAVDVPSSMASTLNGSWKLLSVDGQPVATNQLLIAFRPGFFDATVNCNRVSGYYRLEGSAFVPDKAVATERGCGPSLALDMPITRALQFGMTLAMPTRDRLVARAGARELILVRVAS